jgi:two-component system KDP operon response regulator KdpE
MKILTVDDEPDVIKVITMSFNLQQPDWQVLSARDGETALELVDRERPDLVLLDVAMPEMDGFQVLKEIRRFTDVPVIMLTAKDDEMSKVMGLERGADDYVTKPFSHLELLARVRTVLRRVQSLPLVHEEPFVSGNLRVDYAQRKLFVDGKDVPLTQTEYNLLYYLVRNAGQVLTHEMLLNHVWGPEYADEVDYVKVYISRLRAKIEPDPRHPQYILTEHNLGYRFWKS